MMKRLANIFCIALIVLITMTSAAAAVESGAAPGAGTGDGSGGGSDIAFSLVQTKPQDGATGFSVSDSIWLLFNKNAVNMAVRDNNKANIVLRDSDGDKVSAEVTMKDDQTEPEYRREMVVVPSGPLDPGTTYILTIGSAVQAKNGQTLGKAYTVTFTTAGVKPGSQQSSAVKPTVKQSVDTENPATPAGIDQAADNNAKNTTLSAVSPTSLSAAAIEVDDAGEKTGGDTARLLVSIVFLGGATAALIIRKKGKK
jgi:hypothetical protein